MRILTVLTTLALIGTLAAACGDYSNPQLAEDLEFLRSIPAKEYLELRVAEEDDRKYGEDTAGLTQREDPVLGQVADFYLFTFITAGEINKSVFGFLDFVDLVTRNIPPSLREKNRRVWGPWPSEDVANTDVRFEMIREGNGLFNLSYQVRDAAIRDVVAFDNGWQDCMFGTVEPYGLFRRGRGNLTVDLAACGKYANTGESGFASIGYDTTPDKDNPDGKTHSSIQFDDFMGQEELAKRDPQPINALYVYREEGDLSGAFDFTAWGDLNEGDPLYPLEEQVAIKTRWLSDRSGRADIRISGGDLGTFTVDLQECWGTDLGRLFYSGWPGSMDPNEQPEGLASACSLTPTPMD